MTASAYGKNHLNTFTAHSTLCFDNNRSEFTQVALCEKVNVTQHHFEQFGIKTHQKSSEQKENIVKGKIMDN